MAVNPARDVLDAALAYAGRGWSVIPLWPREKRPLIQWARYQHHRPEEAEIRQWFRRWPRANVGIVTGAVSSLVVVDVDPLHGGSGSLQALEQAHGPLPDTIKATTGGGGLHVYFAHPGGLVPNKVGLVTGIDLRGDGGFVVAPPSVHPSGRPYAWLEPDVLEQKLPAPMPPWLLHLAQESGYRPGHTLAHWRRLVKEGIQEGERNNSIASLAGHLFWHRIDPKVVLDLLLCWNARRCRPPLSDDEVARTVESIMRLHESDEARAGEP